MENSHQNGFSNDDEDCNQRGGPDMYRIRNAQKRRVLQLKRWTQYDKVKEKEETLRQKKGLPLSRKGPKSVRFSQDLILLEAGNHGDTEEVRRLLSEGVCADVANSDGLTALHQCAINKNLDMCRVLINYSANVNAKDKEQWTPLHAAAICGHTEICLLLIRSGADLLALNTDGNMPYDICEDEVTLDAIENEMASRGVTQEMINESRTVPEKCMLLDLKSAVSKAGPAAAIQAFSQLDKQGANALHVAAACGFGDVTRYLISLGMPLSLPDKDGWLALHVGALYNQLEVIEILVSHGENIDAQTKQGETVYELVYDKEMYDKLMLLKRETEKLRNNEERTSSIGLVRRRSSTNPRSASIRRTSMKEKSILSWKEARQEAELRMTAESHVTGNHVDETSLHASLRAKHQIASETIAEGDNSEQECDNDGRLGDVGDSSKACPLGGLADKDLRGSFTHAHPYNSPTRDPDTFPYTPKPGVQTPAQTVLRSLPRQGSQTPPQNVPKAVPRQVPPPNSTQNASRNMTTRPLSDHSRTHQPGPPRGTLTHTPRSSQENLDVRDPSLRSSKQLGATVRPTVLPGRPSVASVKSGSAHTTPIGSVRSSSQTSLHRTPKEEPRKQIASRYYKGPKADSCCLLM